MPLPTEMTGTLHAADATPIVYRQWLHPQARGAIVILHGLGEHGGRYDELAALFYGAGLSVRIPDQRGHGRSGGARGSLRGADDYLDDLKLVFDDFARQTHSVPWLFGHSMGGLVAARFAIGGYARVSGLMLSSPALAIRMNRFQRWLLAVSTRLAPGLAIAGNLPLDHLSHDTEVVRQAQLDPLSHSKMAARVVNFMLASIARVLADAGSFSGPVLLQVAGEDTLVDPQGSKTLFTRLPDGNKTLHYYQDAYHEIFNEAPRFRLPALEDLKSWLTARLSRP